MWKILLKGIHVVFDDKNSIWYIQDKENKTHQENII